MTTIQQQQELSLKNACVEFMFAYQQRNVEKMLSFCDPKGSIYFEPLGNAGKGTIGELGKGLWTALIDCFPDIDNTLDAAVAEAQFGDEQRYRESGKCGNHGSQAGDRVGAIVERHTRPAERQYGSWVTTGRSSSPRPLTPGCTRMGCAQRSLASANANAAPGSCRSL